MSILKTLTIAAALLAGASTLAMAQGTNGSAPPGATQQPGARTGSEANDQKVYKAPNDKTQQYNMQAPGAPSGSK